jgi:hypothetical protein
VTSYPTYGDLFQPSASGADRLSTGRRHVEDALKVLQNRWRDGANLRTLPIDPSTREILNKKGLEFLKNNAKGIFEVDNVKHVGRLLFSIHRYADDLQTFLGVQAKDIQLLAALHDLGKSAVPESMGEYLQSIFTSKDFVNLRVLPHELFSMFWIQQIGLEMKLEPGVIGLLMDQIANHNFGPDLENPTNAFLLDRLPDGTYKHWWLGHWQVWAEKMQSAGMPVKNVYGCTLSPMATCLVLFDRVDGGHPHSWEKFLNQDALSGRMQFSWQTISRILAQAHECALEQVVAVGGQVQNFFTGPNQGKSILEFRPYIEALEMLEKSRAFVLRLKESNRMDRLSFFKVNGDNSVLYQDQKSGWFRIDSAPTNAIKYRWENNAWKQILTSENPISILLETIYHDWESVSE